MGQDVILDFENSPEARRKPKVASSSSSNIRKVQELDRKGGLIDQHYRMKNLDAHLQGLNRSHSAGVHYESTSGKGHEDVDMNVVLKRGSMYQSSEEVMRMRKVRDGRKKIDASCNNSDFLSFKIVDSLPYPGSNEAVLFSQQKRSSVLSLDADTKPSSCSITSKSDFLDLSFRDLPNKNLNAKTSCSRLASVTNSSADDFLEICLTTNSKVDATTKVGGKVPEESRVNKKKSPYNEKGSSDKHASNTQEGDTLSGLPKSFSEKAGMSLLENGFSNSNLKSRFSPFRKMWDPIMKSRSLRTPILIESESVGSPATIPVNIGENGEFCKPMLTEFYKNTPELSNPDTTVENISAAACSPAHLHGILKFESENGNPSFEFSVKDPQEVLTAKPWKTDSTFTSVYTFHSSRKASSTSRSNRGQHGRLPALVGQMQISCYLCSEVGENGSFNNSAVTEFVAYDVAQARRSSAIEESLKTSSEFQPIANDSIDGLMVEKSELVDRNSCMERLDSAKHTSSSCETDGLIFYPWLPTDLQSHQEVAAIVIQIPLNKNQSSKDIEVINSKQNEGSTTPTVDKCGDCVSSGLSPATIKVVTPSGTHGLRNDDEAGPSSLLDRWRFGGGCDCGGWDMACPLHIFENVRSDDCIELQPPQNQKPMLLLLQGSKEKIPALQIKADGEGQYLVDFHARFSALQAFSICIAMLHSSESSVGAVMDKNRQRLCSSSLKLLLEEEVRHLIEAVAVEEKRKAKKRAEHTRPFRVGPTFSPIGRV